MNRKKRSGPNSFHLSIYLGISGAILLALMLFLPLQRLELVNGDQAIVVHGLIDAAFGQDSDSSQLTLFLPMVMSNTDGTSPPVGGTATPEPSSSPTGFPTGSATEFPPGTITVTPEATDTMSPTIPTTPLPTLEPVETAMPTSMPSPTPSPIPDGGLNLALGKTVSQSSTINGGMPERAVDGDTNGTWVEGSITHTGLDSQPWWQVDLGSDSDAAAQFNIDEIVLYNRTDCCSNRLSNFHIFVSAADMSSRSVSELLADSTVWKTEVISPVEEELSSLINTTGRYVKIQLSGTNNYLSLAEVKVFGSLSTNSGSTVQIGQSSPNAYAVEASGEQAVYSIQRSGDLSAISYTFNVLEGGSSVSGNAEAAFVLAEAGHSLSGMALAAPEDYNIKDGDGNLLTNSISFAAGQQTGTLIVEAVSDGQPEVPEFLRIEFAQMQDVTFEYIQEMNVSLIDDDPGFDDDSKLFVGQFEPENGANTTASGYVTVRLSGDNAYGSVNVTFSGLTSEQTAAHIHIGNPVSGPIAESLPMGQIENYRWDIKAADIIATDQGMLEALLSGGLYINVHSANYPGGEIRATLLETDGSSGGGNDPTFNYPPPPYETLTGAALEQDIYRFLSQATFGPTPELIADLKARVDAKGGDRIAAYSEWIDEQLLLQSPSHVDYYYASRIAFADGAGNVDSAIGNFNGQAHPMTGGWLTAAIYGEAQLRERTAFALSEILVVGFVNNGLRPSRISYSDLLKENAFGSYEDLLYNASRHPAMGVWLSHYKNRKTTFDNQGNIVASPDENYAREIMQLFSIGLLELHPDGTLRLGPDGLPIETYTQDDISELARVFTGWGVGEYAESRPNGKLQPPVIAENDNFNRNLSNGNNQIYVPEQFAPMKNFEAQHDTDRKEVLGYVFPPGVDADTELNQVVDILASHPNTAPFIAYRMIQRLTTSNPSPGYIYRVSTAFTDSNGNMGEMVRAILLDPEVRNLDGMDAIGAGRIREPLVQFVTICRLLDCSSSEDVNHPLSNLTNFGLTNQQLNLYEADAARIFVSSNTLNNGNSSIRQAPFSSPTVFNWFLPDYAPSGPIAQNGLVAPEMQHISESIVVSYYNLMYSVLFNPNSLRGRPPLFNGESARLATTTPQEMIDAYMAVMDSNGNGIIENTDAAFSDPSKVREASEAVVDIADGYLCGGWLKAEATGDINSDPREVIVTGVTNALDGQDGNSAENALTARDGRIQEALLGVMIAPQCNVQR
ncbi:MAG: DUF1800 family protein [Chloroflexota bacterium]